MLDVFTIAVILGAIYERINSELFRTADANMFFILFRSDLSPSDGEIMRIGMVCIYRIAYRPSTMAGVRVVEETLNLSPVRDLRAGERPRVDLIRVAHCGADGTIPLSHALSAVR